MDEWQEIDTSPVSRAVLVWQAGRIPVTAMFHDNGMRGDGAWRFFSCGTVPNVKLPWAPTHWMPLPPPPVIYSSGSPVLPPPG
jgi:hypothetical protein